MGYILTEVLPYVGSYQALMDMPVSAVMCISRNIRRINADQDARFYSAVLAGIGDAFGAESKYFENRCSAAGDIITEEPLPQSGAKGIDRLKAVLGVK
jgi:hypothetical protein